MQLKFASTTVLMYSDVAFLVIFLFLQMRKQFGLAISLIGEKPKLGLEPWVILVAQ